MKTLLFIFTVTFINVAYAVSKLSCDYMIMDIVPFAKIELVIADDGTPAEWADITMYGKTHEESVNAVDKSAGEMHHLWISMDTQNEIEMIVYDEAEGVIPSLLINPNMSFGQEMKGSCALTSL